MTNITLTLEQAIKYSGGTVDFSTGIARVVPAVEGGPVPNIGLSNYDIFDPTYRDVLNGKIVDHYYSREIGHETLSIFRQRMRTRMQEIMPVYNKLYLSTQIEFDPLSTVDLTTLTASDNTTNVTGHGNNVTSSSAVNGARTVNSDTPQVLLSPNGDYATSGVDVNSQTTGTANVEEDSTQSTDQNASGNSKTTGYQGIASQLLMSYRESIIGVDRMVINELEDLFMQVMDTPDNLSHYSVGSALYGWR